MNSEYEKAIRDICEKHAKNYPQVLKSKKFRYLWEYILSQTLFLQQFEKDFNWKFSASTYVNWTLNHRICFSCCKICGKAFDKFDVKWNGNYPEYCCIACVNKSSKHIQSVQSTLMQRYGVKCPAQFPLFYQKMEQTNLKLYGVKNCWQLPKVKEINNSPEILSRRLASLSSYNMEHYGVPWYVQSDEFKQKAKIVDGSSKEEKEIAKWLKDAIFEDVEVGTFKVIAPKQLDIYIPSKKIAIEFNGTYYHSIEHGAQLDYHLHKTISCENLSIRLIHIWEDEWNNDKDNVKNFILHFIDGTLDFKQFLVQENNSLFSIDRSKFNRCAIPNQYEVIGERSPEIILRAKVSKDKYKVPDCGKLILKLKEN